MNMEPCYSDGFAFKKIPTFAAVMMVIRVSCLEFLNLSIFGGLDATCFFVPLICSFVHAWINTSLSLLVLSFLME